MSSVRVLLFASDPTTQRQIQLLLDAHEFLVAAVAGPDEAARLLRSEVFDGIIVDAEADRSLAFLAELAGQRGSAARRTGASAALGSDAEPSPGQLPTLVVLDGQDEEQLQRALKAGAADVDPGLVLRWRAGREAAAHEIYLSADETAVADGTALLETVADSSYTPVGLELGSTYYWKVNEVNEAEAISSWQGSVWSFATLAFATIDDFESYDDEDNRIYDTWIDGWVNETGSTVGYLEEPFAERSIINSGRQSMPLAYENAGAPFYSEAERDLGGADWSARGADTLRLYVTGQADNDPVTLYVAVEDTAGQVAVVAHADAEIALSTTWQEWQIPFSDLTGVNLSSVSTMYIGLGDRDNPSAGGTGLIFVDDIGVGHPASQ